MIKSIIFLAGIHGVGKGDLAKHLSDHFSLVTFSASALIKSEKNRPVDVSKITIDPEKNQNSLVSAINRLDLGSDKIILDGHFVLLTENGFFKVPLNTFDQIPIDIVILKTLDPKKIFYRLEKRDGKSINIERLSKLQTLEISSAKKITKLLNIPLITCEDDNYDKVVTALKDQKNPKGGK